MKIVKNSLFYLTTIFFQGLMTFFMLWVYTHNLSTVEYGLITLAFSLNNLLSILFLLSLHSSLARFYFDYKNDSQKAKDFFGTIILSVIFISLTSAFVFLFLKKYLLIPFLKNIPFYPYIFLGVITSIFSPVILLGQTLFQVRQQGTHYAALSLSYSAVTTLLTLIAIYWFKAQATGIMWALFISNFIFYLIVIIIFQKISSWKLKKIYLSQSLKYALPLIPHSIFTWFTLIVNKIIINNLASTSSVGIYEVAFYLANITNVLTTAVNQAYYPWFFDKLSSKQTKKQPVGEFSEAAVLLYSIVALIVSLFSREVLSFLVGKSFREAWRTIPFLSFAYVFNGIYFFYINVLFFHKQFTKYIPVCTFFSSILNISLNYILIPKMGILGSGIATLISIIITSMLSYFLSIRIDNIRFPTKRLYILAFVSFLLSLTVFVKTNDYLMNLLLRSFVLILLFIFLFFIYQTKIKVILTLFINQYQKYAPFKNARPS